MSKNIATFPSFHYMTLPTLSDSDCIVKKRPFIEQVERELKRDLQKYDTFGCQINDCHTHAGSKIHFSDFTEAELLFHNSYYNKSFAQLTQDWIFNKCLKIHNGDYDIQLFNNKNNKIKNILLIGYETYSELYLQELKELLSTNLNKLQNEKDAKTSFDCEYCVYETISQNLPNGARKTETHIKNLNTCIGNILKIDSGNNYKDFSIDETLCVFIVPINTSLSTMDKMIAKFYEETKAEDISINNEYVCLITLYKKDGYTFFTLNDNANNDEFLLNPLKEKFEYLNDSSKIATFVLIDDIKSYAAKNCPDCFPDKNDSSPKSLIDEKPMFGVNRGSVVPMLKVGSKKYLEPINEKTSVYNKNNLLKVYNLSNFLSYKHISRGNNHFQYYFNTNKFLEDNANEIQYYLLNEVKKTYSTDKLNCHVFDYLVAPRHQSNAGWVHMVNNVVFDGLARIIYFDVDKEYRSNIKAKYSDLISSLENIQNSRQNFLIRFHFVDDVIQSGENFLRAKNLMTSLTNIVNTSKNLSFFDSIILLINRLSPDTQKFYIKNTQKGKYFFYVDVNISPMRSHEDACTLCKLIADYHSIKKECAMNFMSNVCSDVIKRHEISPPPDKAQNNSNNSHSDIEKKFVFFISHLLNERTCNKLSLEIVEDKKTPIDIEENANEIIKILSSYYDYYEISTVLTFLDYNKETNEIWKIAFIKAISRPFFTYHLRLRQASFSFCLRELNKMLFETDIFTDKPLAYIDGKMDCNKLYSICFHLMLIQTLVKAIADMNSNYLFRNIVLKKLIFFAKIGDEIYKKLKSFDPNNHTEFFNKNICNLEYVQKRIFTSESLIHYTKKDIVLSRDTTKSLLLEHVLLENSEKGFFSNIQKEPNVSEFIDSDKELSINGKIYLENNTILKNILSDDKNLDKLIKETSNISKEDQADTLYFFENFKEIWNINGCKNRLSFYNNSFIKYKELKKAIDNFAFGDFKKRCEFSDLINNFFESISSNTSLQSLVFVHDNNEENPLFQFFTMADDPSLGKTPLKNCKYEGLKTSQAFFYDENIFTIKNKLNCNMPDFFFIEDNLTNHSSGKSLIVRFGNKNQSVADESIYVQIWGFDFQNCIHWFSLKLLLTLRENFIELIKSVNLQELIEERKIEMQKVALSINKATTHAQAQKYFKHKIYDRINDENIDLIKNSNKFTRQQYKDVITLQDEDYEFVLYDTYYQLLSDEFISSLYRKLIRKEKDLFENEINKIQFIDLANIISERFSTSKETLSDKRILPVDFESELYLSDVGEKIKLFFKFNFTNDVGKLKHNNWKRPTSFEPIINIINLMSMNVMQHKENVGSENKINIDFENSGIVFKNTIKSEMENQIKMNVDMYTKIPPWLFGNDMKQNGQKNGNHITLWTLIQSSKMDTSKKNAVIVNVEIKDATFQVSLNLFNN